MKYEKKTFVKYSAFTKVIMHKKHQRERESVRKNKNGKKATACTKRKMNGGASERRSTITIRQ